MIRAALLALLLTACSAAPVPNSQYVLDGHGSASIDFAYLVLVRCSQQPKSMSDLRAYCDLDHPEAVAVPDSELSKYGQGQAWPPDGTEAPAGAPRTP